MCLLYILVLSPRWALLANWVEEGIVMLKETHTMVGAC